VRADELRHRGHERGIVEAPEPPLRKGVGLVRMRLVERLGRRPFGLAADVVEVVADDVDVRVAGEDARTCDRPQ
jgi:hypothetical protein